MIKAMKAFKYIMRINNVKDYMACATSALREANNGEEIVRNIQSKTGIDIRSLTESAKLRLLPPPIFLNGSIRTEPSFISM